MGLRIGVPRETFPGERRVALTPNVLEILAKSGVQFLIERSAGEEAGFSDREYEEKGAGIVAGRAELFASSGVIVQVRTVGANPIRGREDLPLLKKGQVVIGFTEPLTALTECLELANAGVSTFAMELIPRITRAQGMDALSSMANIAGYKAVLLAANMQSRMFPMMTTAAGTVPPARVFVIGGGVAGLQAIATARRLGALVSGYDVRPAVKEQVESLGAKFVSLDIESEVAEAAGGYAMALGEDFYRRQRERMTAVVRENNVVITTAAVPGKKAPLLITADMVRGMMPGSVIVDLAAERGGNCELTRAGETIVESGVTIMGPLNLPSSVPYHASQLYGRNVVNLLKHLIQNGVIAVNFADEITRETLVTNEGKVVHPRVAELLEGVHGKSSVR